MFVLDTNTVVDYFKGSGKVAERPSFGARSNVVVSQSDHWMCLSRARPWPAGLQWLPET
jgi:hypothetical protein